MAKNMNSKTGFGACFAFETHIFPHSHLAENQKSIQRASLKTLLIVEPQNCNGNHPTLSWWILVSIPACSIVLWCGKQGCVGATPGAKLEGVPQEAHARWQREERQQRCQCSCWFVKAATARPLGSFAVSLLPRSFPFGG